MCSSVVHGTGHMSRLQGLYSKRAGTRLGTEHAFKLLVVACVIYSQAAATWKAAKQAC